MIRSKLILPLLIVVCSCNYAAKQSHNIGSDIKETVTVYEYDYRVWQSAYNKDSFRDSIITYLDTINLHNRIYTLYALNDSVSVQIPFAIENDSLFIDFYFYDLYYPNLDTIYLNYKNEMVEVIKSECLEHLCAFWNRDYGLIALMGDGLTLFDKETMKGFAKETFYDYIIKQEQERSRLIFEGLEPDKYR